MEKRLFLYAAGGLCLIALCGCATKRKINEIQMTNLSARVMPGAEKRLPDILPTDPDDSGGAIRVMGPDGRETLIMRAVRDDSTGEMVATDRISASVVTARFRNVAERRGTVELEFSIDVCDSLLDDSWQLRLQPLLFTAGDTTLLDRVLLTGSAFRRSQLRGYEQYDRFIRSIERDSSRFLDKAQLEIFLRRNLPEVFRFRDDTSFVSDEQFASAFGISEGEALSHYTRNRIVKRIGKKNAARLEMWQRYVHNPIEKDGVRLDTVITPGNGFSYDYVQPLDVGRDQKKAVILLRSSIYDAGGKLCDVPEGQPVTFYISSLGSLVDTLLIPPGDPVYAGGIEAIRRHDYKSAIELLGRYSDYNTAVALLSAERNISALALLDSLDSTPATEYLKTILHSRRGEDREAVQCYINACTADRSYIHRGNLDPEVAVLIKRYNLNAED